MSPSPYRISESSTTTAAAPRDEASLDVELLPVLGIVWLASVARVVFAFIGHETFGADATLAMLAVVGLPLLALNALCSVVRHTRA